MTESKNHTGELFGEDKLIRIVEQNNSLPAQGLLDEIFREVDRHSRGVTQNDDITLVVLKITGAPT